MLKTTYDLRGILNKDLTYDIIYNNVLSFLKRVKNNKIPLLAIDFNKKNLLIKNFLEQKFKFQFLGVLPTPLFYYEVIKRKTPGIMITASHLPLNYSGLKFLLENGEAWRPIVKNKKSLIKIKLVKYKKNDFIIKNEIYKNYFDEIKKIVQPKEKIYVNFDIKNLFLKTSLPFFKKIKIYHNKNSPIKIKSDIDNDRIYLYIKNKKIHSDLIFYFISLNKNFKKLGVQIYFSNKLKNLLLEKNKKIYFIPTGHYFFKKFYKKYNIDIAFETSGHFYMFKHFKTESPYLALSLFLHFIKNNNISLDEILKLNSSLNIYRWNINQKNVNLKKLVFLLKKEFHLKIKKFDGYLLYNKNYFIHLRKSHTENKIRISYEGDIKFFKNIKKWLTKI